MNQPRWKPELLLAAIEGANGGSAPIELLVENGDFFRIRRLDCHDGERYSHLERDAGRPDLLTEIVKQLGK